MNHEYSCGAVLYTRRGEDILYALVIERAGHCGLPKGHVEPGETERETTLREIREEVGVAARILDGFREEIEYSIGENTMKHVTYFLCEFDDQEMNPMPGEVREVRLLPFADAAAALSHGNTKDVLRAGDAYIRNGHHS